jgi:ElaB/YqjD/DUF883 family membrane-anchored ribosome-binding protein
MDSVKKVAQEIYDRIDNDLYAGATVQGALERGADAYGQAKETVTDMYTKTAKAVSETYDKAKSYGTENPGTAILIALVVGVGLGFLLSAGSRHSRGGRFARPVVNALSQIAQEYFH